MVIYKCEDTMESVFSGIYQAYEEKQKPEETRLSLSEEPFLFAEYRGVVTDPVKTEKVIRTLRRKFGEDDYESLCLALSSYNEEKVQAVYQTVARGLKEQTKPGHLLDALADPHVRNTYSFAKNASREHCHMLGFLRFEEFDNGVLYSKVSPKNNLLMFMMPHFADRFPSENFMIYDEGRKLVGVHPKQKDWYLLSDMDAGQIVGQFAHSESEQWYQELFCRFHDSIFIRERENRALQRNLLPLRFREYMVEFK